jgi:hypothetical protein
MPIHIRLDDKTDIKMQIADISIFIIETMPFPSASHTVNIVVFGVLCRSI